MKCGNNGEVCSRRDWDTEHQSEYTTEKPKTICSPTQYVSILMWKYSTCVIWCQTYFPLIVSDTHSKWIDKREQIIFHFQCDYLWREIKKVDIIDAFDWDVKALARIWEIEYGMKWRGKSKTFCNHSFLASPWVVIIHVHHARRLSDCWWSSEITSETGRTKTTSTFYTLRECCIQRTQIGMLQSQHQQQNNIRKLKVSWCDVDFMSKLNKFFIHLRGNVHSSQSSST